MICQGLGYGAMARGGDGWGGGGGAHEVDTDSTISDRRGQDLYFSPVKPLEKEPPCELNNKWYRLFHLKLTWTALNGFQVQVWR